MRSLVFLSATVVAIAPALAVDFSSADPAEARISGYIDIQGGRSWLNDKFNGDYQIPEYTLQGRANVWLGQRTSVQFDAWDQEFSHPAPFGQERLFGGAIHASVRDPSRFLFGGVVSVGRIWDWKFASVAVEAQHYFGNLTLYGQAGYGWSFDTDTNQTMPYANFAARYFLDPNFELEGQIGYGCFEGFEGLEAGVLRWQATIERKLGMVPLSIYLAYEGVRTQSAVEGERNAQGVFVGIKLISTDTLQGNDRHGATLVDNNFLFGLPIWY